MHYTTYIYIYVWIYSHNSMLWKSNFFVKKIHLERFILYYLNWGTLPKNFSLVVVVQHYIFMFCVKKEKKCEKKAELGTFKLWNCQQYKLN